MHREALVVGINRYPLFRGEATGKPQHLATAAADAEAIAHLLETYGNFKVRRLPLVTTKGKWQVNPDPKPWEMVKNTDLEAAIAQLFNPPGRSIPDTALLFFAGHGLRKVQGGVSEGFLATSEVCPTAGQWGVSLQWLRQLLQSSPVRQQIVWLDCCYSGELLNFSQADPKYLGKERDRCFVAASREFEVAYEQIGGDHGILTSILVKALDPQHQRDGWVSNYGLVDFINQQLQASPQRPIFHNSGSEIILTGKKEKVDRAVLAAGVCPYKGLSAFEFNEEDPQYFYGRTALTDSLLEKVQESNFLAVVGASGSGKSSVVKAGLLHQLRLGQRLSGSDRWEIQIFRPGENPLRSLAKVFVASEDLPASDVEDATKSKYLQQSNQAESLLNTGAVGLAELVKAKVGEGRLVLVVDQFEEAFTLCESPTQRQQFFECLLGALPLLEQRICLILTLRADFFGKCAEQDYAGLADLIQNYLVTVQPMTETELQQAITQPAYQVGLEVEQEPVQQMIADVEGPASLPLLQYTLTELWRDREVNRLTVAQYTKLGGVKGTLQQRAEAVYQDLSPQAQDVAKRIFLDLIQLGEGTEDTRRQAFKVELGDAGVEPLVEKVLQQLADARLVVTSQVRTRGETEQTLTVIDIAHESLIRHWSRLRQWVGENRVTLRQKRQIEAAAEQWLAKGESRDYLLQGLRLAEAQEYLQDYNKVVPLSDLARSFVEKSKRARRRNQIIRWGIAASFLGLFALGAIISNIFRERAQRQATVATLRQKAAEVQNLASLKTENVNSLVLAIQATGKNLDFNKNKVFPFTESSLSFAVESVREHNLLRGHEDSVYSVAFSPDGNSIVSGGDDGTIRLWDLEGNQIGEFRGHESYVSSVAFSPDGNSIVSGGGDGTVRLWDLEGNQIGEFRGHEDSISSVAFSPDGDSIVSGSRDGTLRLWDLEGNQIGEPFRGHEGYVYSVAFSPDGNSIISGGDEDGTIRLWDLEGNQIGEPFRGHESYVYSVAFSPDGNSIVSGSWDKTIRLWNLEGNQIGEPVRGHENHVTSVAFSPDGNSIVSGDEDGTIRLWDLEGNQIGEPFRGHENHVTSVAFSPDGNSIVSGGADETIRLWDLEGNPLGKPFRGYEYYVRSVAFSPDGNSIVSGSEDGTIRLWDLEGNQIGGPFRGHEDDVTHEENDVTSVAFSPDGNSIVSGSWDKTIRLWDLEGNPLGKPFRGHESSVSSVAFSPDGNSIVSGGADETIRLWDLEGTQIGEPFRGHENSVSSVAFSPDGNSIVSGDENGTVRLWDLEGNQIGEPFHGYEAHVGSVAFSPDGNFIISGSWDGTIRLWDLEGNQIGEPFRGHE